MSKPSRLIQNSRMSQFLAALLVLSFVLNCLLKEVKVFINFPTYELLLTISKVNLLMVNCILAKFNVP